MTKDALNHAGLDWQFSPSVLAHLEPLLDLGVWHLCHAGPVVKDLADVVSHAVALLAPVRPPARRLPGHPFHDLAELEKRGKQSVTRRGRQ